MSDSTPEVPTPNSRPSWGKSLVRAVFALVLVAGGVAAVRVAPPPADRNAERAAPRYSALIRIARTQPRILPPSHAERSDDFDTCKRDVIAQLRSEKVLKAALKRNEVKKLAFAPEKGDAAAWLKAHLRIDSPGDADLVRVGLDGEDAATLTTLVNAVVHAYLEEMVYAEKLERNSLVTTLEKAYGAAVDSIKTKTQSFERAKQNFGLEERSDAEQQALAREILEIKRELRKAKLEQARATRPDAKAELLALQKHVDYLNGELAALVKEKDRRPALNGELEAMRDDIESEKEFARLLRRRLDLQRLELPAPARVTLFQSAEAE